jgi:hypothetical protein
VVVGMLIVAGLSSVATVMASSLDWQITALSVGETNSASTTTPLASAATHTTTAATTPTTPRATSTPVIRPSPTASNQTPSLRGTVASVDASAGQFVLTSNGKQVTVTVTDTTTFNGAASSLSALNPGMRVSVRYASQTNSTFVATSVFSSTDN